MRRSQRKRLKVRRLDSLHGDEDVLCFIELVSVQYVVLASCASQLSALGALDIHASTRADAFVIIAAEAVIRGSEPRILDISGCGVPMRGQA